MKKNIPFKILLWIGGAFFAAEAILHVIGLRILEHDKIFIPTHDRYIALFALTYAVLLILISTNLEKYKTLFKLTMLGILLAIINGAVIAYTGGYGRGFPVVTLDAQLGSIGIGAVVWYLATWFVFLKSK